MHDSHWKHSNLRKTHQVYHNQVLSRKFFPSKNSYILFFAFILKIDYPRKQSNREDPQPAKKKTVFQLQLKRGKLSPLLTVKSGESLKFQKNAGLLFHHCLR